MFNPKLSGIAAGVGFILSFLLGIITGAGFPLILIRAFIFAAVFFALISAGYGAISMYLPELLDSGGEGPSLGTQVDIFVDGDGGGGEGSDISMETGELGDGLSEFMGDPGDSGENIDSLPGNTLDQNGEDGYNVMGNVEGTPESLKSTMSPAMPAEMNFSSGEIDSVDVLPDLDAMSGAFNSGSASAGGESAGGSDSSSKTSEGLKPSSEKAGLDGDFNVHEMASAIQTILKRENKG